MNDLFRKSVLYTRGFPGAGVKVIMAAGGWIDRYANAVKDVTNNGFRQTTSLKGQGPVDIGIPDTMWSFNGTPVVYNPTMDLMAELTGDATWNRRAYGIDPKTFVVGVSEGEDKLFSAPLDPFDQRITRFSLDGRYTLYCLNPRPNFVHEFAS